MYQKSDTEKIKSFGIIQIIRNTFYALIYPPPPSLSLSFKKVKNFMWLFVGPLWCHILFEWPPFIKNCMLRVARFKNHDFMSAWFGKLNNSCVISRESCFSCKRKKNRISPASRKQMEKIFSEQFRGHWSTCWELRCWFDSRSRPSTCWNRKTGKKFTITKICAKWTNIILF